MFIEGKPPPPLLSSSHQPILRLVKKTLFIIHARVINCRRVIFFIYFLHTLFSEKKPTNCFESRCLSKIPLKEMKINCESPPSCVNIHIPALIAITL